MVTTHMHGRPVELDNEVLHLLTLIKQIGAKQKWWELGRKRQIKFPLCSAGFGPCHLQEALFPNHWLSTALKFMHSLSTIQGLYWEAKLSEKAMSTTVTLFTGTLANRPLPPVDNMHFSLIKKRPPELPPLNQLL